MLTPAAEAWQAEEYVTLSQPHTGIYTCGHVIGFSVQTPPTFTPAISVGPHAWGVNRQNLSSSQPALRRHGVTVGGSVVGVVDSRVVVDAVEEDDAMVLAAYSTHFAS